MHFVVRIVQRVRAVDVDEIELGVGGIDLEFGEEFLQRDVIGLCIVTQRPPEDQRASAARAFRR